MRSRYPKEGDKELRAEGPEVGGDARQSLVYRAGDVDPSWTNPTDIDLVLMGFWTPVIHRVREIDPAKRVLRFKSSNSRTVDQFERLPRYYLSNVFEKMGAGEWYLNKMTGILYYYPLPGEEPSKAEVVAPMLNSPLVTIQGDLAADKTVQYLQFKGIRFQNTGTDLDRYDGMYRQGHLFLGAAITATALRHGLFSGCTFEQLGDYALELADGCRDVTVEKCHFWDLGAGAIQIGVTDLPTLLRPAGSGTPGQERDRATPGSLRHRGGQQLHPQNRDYLERMLRHRQQVRLGHEDHPQRDFRHPLGRDRVGCPLESLHREGLCPWQ